MLDRVLILFLLTISFQARACNESFEETRRQLEEEGRYEEIRNYELQQRTLELQQQRELEEINQRLEQQESEK